MSSMDQYRKEKRDIEYQKRIIYNRAQSRINYQKKQAIIKAWKDLEKAVSE